MRVLGVDPGGRNTGLVLRHKDDVVWSSTVRRLDSGNEPLVDYIDRVLDEAADILWAWTDREPELIAVEGINDPTPHMGMIAVRGLLDCAAVLGAVIAWRRETDARLVVVPPGGHGSAPAVTYPAVLRRAGRHVRSAWDVAGAGLVLARWEGRR